MKISWLSALNTVNTRQSKSENALMLSTDLLIVELTKNKLTPIGESPAIIFKE